MGGGEGGASLSEGGSQMTCVDYSLRIEQHPHIHLVPGLVVWWSSGLVVWLPGGQVVLLPWVVWLSNVWWSGCLVVWWSGLSGGPVV